MVVLNGADVGVGWLVLFVQIREIKQRSQNQEKADKGFAKLYTFLLHAFEVLQDYF